MSEGNDTGLQQWGSLSMPSLLAAAHELKAPLALIRQLSYQLEIAGNLSPEQALVQERIRLTSERSLRLVENITRTRRLDETIFALEPIQARSVWQEVIDEATPYAQGLGQAIELIVPQKPLLVVAHRELLPAILMGLCDNALAHNPTGSRVVVSARKHKKNVTFSVRDNGPVIERQMYKQLRQRLGNAPQPLGARPNSSGLGLWIAGAFARSMSSQITMTRHHSGGMTFSLHVPTSGQLSLL